jgi:hypothetical protein
LSVCSACGEFAATRRVLFLQIIGAGIMFHLVKSSGELCKSCIHGYFWTYTLITLCLGWWSVISFLATPFIVLNNVVRYVLCLGMPPRPKAQPRPAKPATGARPPSPQPQGGRRADEVGYTVTIPMAAPRR